MRMDLICLDLRSHGESTLLLKEYAHVFNFNFFYFVFRDLIFSVIIRISYWRVYWTLIQDIEKERSLSLSSFLYSF